MRISVVIMAHGRRNYLRGAVDSALHQAGVREPYEVLVTKDFPDPALDGHPALRVLDSTGTSAGEMIAGAARAASGEVLAFLDDDDLWEPTKLATVEAAFDRWPDLGYFGHGQTPVNEAGAPAPVGGAMLRRGRRLARVSELHLAPPIGPEAVGSLWADPGNDSSISLRTADLRAREPYLRRITASIDTFLLWTGLLSGHGLLFRSDPLTRLRVHPENFSRGPRGSFHHYMERYRSMETDHLLSHAIVLEMAGDSPWARPVLERRMDDIRHFLDVARGDVPRRRMLAELVEGRGDPVGTRVSKALYVVGPPVAQVANFLNAMARW